MKTLQAVAGVAVLGAATACAQSAAVGKAAPDFRLTDTRGQEHSLSSYKGKYVILEWTNYECPFVKKHYDSGNMQKLQAACTASGAVWLTVCSSAPGKQGHYEAAKWNELTASKKSAAAAVLLDADGKVGRLYGARTTPHMFVINPEGMLIYAGAIDNKPGTNPAEIEGAVNYVKNALDSALAGKTVDPAETNPYGCSVKY